jgi:50S ribosomal subunit-associated GTPase HflX
MTRVFALRLEERSANDTQQFMLEALQGLSDSGKSTQLNELSFDVT